MTWRDNAAEWAQTCFPREACGLVVVRKGRELFVPAANKAESDDHFIIDPEDYALAEDVGEIVGIFHSHCNIPATPSEGDLVSCEQTGLKWHILSLPNGVWNSFTPSGYVAPYVCRQFQYGVLDCWTLCCDWYERERGVTFPARPAEDVNNWWHKGKNIYLDHYREFGFEDIAEPEPGALLFIQHGANVPNHAAIYLGDDMILHHVQGRLSSRDAFGGYWKKNTVKILRYIGI